MTVVRTFELSRGGMSVYASEPLEVGTMVVCEGTLPGHTRQMRLRAVVRNQRGFRLGFEFLELSETDTAELIRYLNSLVDVVEI